MIEKFNSALLCFSVNMPGKNKLSDDAKIIFDAGLDEILNLDLKILETKTDSRASGFEAIIVVDENPLMLKKKALHVEHTHKLGRFMDIDVLDTDKKHISRADLSLPPRLCFVCGENAKLCARSAKHPLNELLEFIQTEVQKYIGD